MHRLIYQLFLGRTPGACLPEDEGQVLVGLERYDWEQFRALGFSHVYLLGMFDSRGPIVVNEEEGVDLVQSTYQRTPSVFAIRDHTRVNPRLGSSSDFLRLVSAIKSAGLKVLVDFVPNHTGLEHPWLETHPDFYKSENGSSVRAFSGDVAVLDYENPALREEMSAILMNIAQMGVDGARVDMAHLIPASFWQWALEKVKNEFPDFICVAEAYGDSVYDWEPLIELLRAGFEGVYHEYLYRNLKLWADEGNSQPLFDHLEYVLTGFNNVSWLVTYLSNHDDSFVEPLEPYRKGLQCLVSLLPGDVLLFNGSLNGRNKRLAHHCLEPLEDSLFEIINVPGWWKAWSEYLDTFKPRAVAISLNDDYWWQITLHTESGMMHNFWFNPTQEKIPLPDGKVLFKMDDVTDVALPGGFLVTEA